MVDSISSVPQLLPYDSSTRRILENQHDNTFTRHISAEMDHLDEAPPSYSDAISAYKTASELALQTEHAWFKESALPPLANYLVKGDKEPSSWKLLSGPLISNAVTPFNENPIKKRLYRVLYPPNKYEDVYLHKTTWSASTSSLPRFHVELFGKDRYEPEPIVILGPIDHDCAKDVKITAARYMPKVFARIRDNITQTARFVTFCESEFFSWDWRCKTIAASQDMRKLILAGKRDCSARADLITKLQQYLEFVGDSGRYQDVVRSMSQSIAETSLRLDRLRL